MTSRVGLTIPAFIYEELKREEGTYRTIELHRTNDDWGLSTGDLVTVTWPLPVGLINGVETLRFQALVTQVFRNRGDFRFDIVVEAEDREIAILVSESLQRDFFT